jgi:hypothetical protein
MSIDISEELSATHLIRLRRCLDATEYPATRTEILVAASIHCGDPDVLVRLAVIPDRTYGGSFSVIQATKLFSSRHHMVAVSDSLNPVNSARI